MEVKFLVSFATVHGSTQEVSEVIAATIREQGITVDLVPAGSVKMLKGYQAIILGTALYIGHIHKDAKGFLTRFQREISEGIPIAIFAGGPLKPEDNREEIRGMLDQQLAKYPWLKPISIELIGGKYDPAKGVKFPWNLLPAMKNVPPADMRDWAAIRNWAIDVTKQFQTA